ncbi:MAG: ATP-binding protein [bacterium]
MGFLLDHLDFIYLVYGLAFFLLALTTYTMERQRGSGTHWRYLCLFGITHGVNEWLDMLVPALGNPLWLNVFRGSVLILSFFFLFEFGRRSIVWGRRWKAGAWIYCPGLLVLMAWTMIAPQDFNSLVRLTFGFPAGILTALALWQSGVPRNGSGLFPRVTASLGMVGYAVASGLVVAPAHFWPATVFNTNWFLQNTGIPVQVVRCALACTVALSLWRRHVVWRINSYPRDYVQRIRRGEAAIVIAVGLALLGGWGLTERAETECREDHEGRLLSLSRGIAAAISPKVLEDLGGTGSNLNSLAYDRLKAQCLRIGNAEPTIRYVYIMALRGDKVVFLLDVEPDRFNQEVDKPNATPGSEYMGAPPEITSVFKTGNPVVSKLYHDEWGTFISGYAPIFDSSHGAVVAVLGMDELSQPWMADISMARLLRLILTGFSVLFLLACGILWRREMRASEIRNAAGKRAQHQQAALLRLANSPLVAEGNMFMIARDVTRETAEVLEVEQVELWFRADANGEFRAEDIYKADSGTHMTGQLASYVVGGTLQDLLDGGRVVASSNCQTDARWGSLRASLLGGEAKAILMAPIRHSGQLVGRLVVIQASRSRNWLTDEMRFVAEMADQVAHTLVNDARRKAEEALRKAHDELEARVRERTEALSVKNAELMQEIKERLRVEEERRSLEEQVQQSQKLESLGLMAGGIAHDFNNILMAILGNVELAMAETPSDSPLCEYLKDIDHAAFRAAELSRQMLIYSGRGHATLQGIDLNSVVTEINSILKVSLGKKIRIEYDLESGLPPVDGDSTQLQQVLMNLVINAAEAIGHDTGSITLRTGTIQCDKGMFANMWLKEDLPEGRYILVEVADTGCGMDEETLKRIFDPFFTTKFTGRGLGLAAVLGIVRGHHGALDVSSQAGLGTTFRVFFPEGRHPPGREDSSVPVKVDWKGAGAILLVDDEEPIQRLGRKLLEQIGFTVIVAGNGKEAVEVFRQKHDLIRCVLMDVTMPKLDGKEALDEILKIDPKAKVILSSGYPEDNVAGRFQDWKMTGFLSKPYKFQTLVAHLRSALED